MLIKPWFRYLAISSGIILLILLCGCISPHYNLPGPSGPASRDPGGLHTYADSLTGETCIPITINQSDDTQITVPCRPRRIVATSQHVVEMLIAIGAADRIVGTSRFTLNETTIHPYIPNARAVGDSSSLDMEQVLSLHPDILILPDRYATDAIISRCHAANITLLYLDCYELAHHPADARALGKLTGREARAESYALMVEGTIRNVSGRIATLPTQDYPRVYFETPQDYSTTGKGSNEDDLIRTAGGNNIAGDLPFKSLIVSREWILDQNPDYIMKLVYQQYLPKNDLAAAYSSALKSLKTREGWEKIHAVKENRTYVINSYMKTGPRAYIYLVYLAKTLHPAQFRDMDPHGMLDDYAREYVAGSNETIVMYPEPV
jgi:iron complex transport system substrate-binding protein